MVRGHGSGEIGIDVFALMSINVEMHSFYFLSTKINIDNFHQSKICIKALEAETHFWYLMKLLHDCIKISKPQKFSKTKLIGIKRHHIAYRVSG